MSSQAIVQSSYTNLQLPPEHGGATIAGLQTLLISPNESSGGAFIASGNTQLLFSDFAGEVSVQNIASVLLIIDETGIDHDKTICFNQENSLTTSINPNFSIFSGQISPLQFQERDERAEFSVGAGIVEFTQFGEGLFSEEIHVEVLDTRDGISFVWSDAMSGTINGINSIFSLSMAPSSPGAIRLYNNGLLLKLGSGKDFTYTAPTTITFEPAAIPIPGDVLDASYQVR